MLVYPSAYIDAKCYMQQTQVMRTVGVREARQNLSALLDEVRKGREVVITERGRPVAKLVPPDRPRGKGVPNLAAFRRKMPVLDPPLSATIAEDRADRL
jgi:prevent-host-death family protein